MKVITLLNQPRRWLHCLEIQTATASGSIACPSTGTTMHSLTLSWTNRNTIWVNQDVLSLSLYTTLTIHKWHYSTMMVRRSKLNRPQLLNLTTVPNRTALVESAVKVHPLQVVVWWWICSVIIQINVYAETHKYWSASNWCVKP